ncbi:hypothetical protein JW926_13415 [Candidatus Sumerlaeota bacterium]|nr:hypothetical protein [Candidatus Sumerlaeota bacterium]
MIRIKLIVLGFILLLITSGCVTYETPVRPPMGFLFTKFKAPLMTDFHKTDTGANVMKTSMKKTYYFHEFLLTGINVAWGEADIPEIAAKGGIQTVTYADYEFLNVLGVYAEFQVNVHGY